MDNANIGVKNRYESCYIKQMTDKQTIHKYDWICCVCGKILTPREIDNGHICDAEAISLDKSTVKKAKNSIIINGCEYWVDDDKLKIIDGVVNY